MADSSTSPVGIIILFLLLMWFGVIPLPIALWLGFTFFFGVAAFATPLFGSF